MKDTIYTIPLTDAFKANDECPFCFIERKLEEDSISFTLGCSYMEDDIRMITDQLGFCQTHYKKLYDYGNKLGLALILNTHYEYLEEKLASLFDNAQIPKTSWFQKASKGKFSNIDTAVTPKELDDTINSCYICNRMEKDMERYIQTFFYLLNTNDEFKELFLSCKGFCLPHFTKLLDTAPLALKESEKDDFLKTLHQMLTKSFSRIHEDISWFVEKYDYKNKDKPWKNSEDAIPRAIQKVSGIYVADEPFKESI